MSVVAAKFIIITVVYRKDLPKNLGEKGRNFVPFRLTCVAQKLKTPSYFLHTPPPPPPPPFPTVGRVPCSTLAARLPSQKNNACSEDYIACLAGGIVVPGVTFLAKGLPLNAKARGKIPPRHISYEFLNPAHFRQDFNLTSHSTRLLIPPTKQVTKYRFGVFQSYLMWPKFAEPANRRRISGRRFSPSFISPLFFGGKEATTGNTSAFRRLKFALLYLE